jgi:NADH:ubiquinone oxidoreductase subunit E
MTATIEICMGSSCFSRRNPEHLRIIREYLAQRDLSDSVNVNGHLCEEQCSEGPNIRINGRMYHRLTAESLAAALDEELKPGGRP